MPLVTPCASPRRRRSQEPGYSATQRAFTRHFGDIFEAPTYLRIGGTWRSVTTPSQDLIDTADMVLQGGHLHEVSSAVVTAIEAAGLCLGVDDEGTYTEGYSDIYINTFT